MIQIFSWSKMMLSIDRLRLRLKLSFFKQNVLFQICIEQNVFVCPLHDIIAYEYINLKLKLIAFHYSWPNLWRIHGQFKIHFTFRDLHDQHHRSRADHNPARSSWSFLGDASMARRSPGKKGKPWQMRLDLPIDSTIRLLTRTYLHKSPLPSCTENALDGLLISCRNKLFTDAVAQTQLNAIGVNRNQTYGSMALAI